MRLLVRRGQLTTRSGYRFAHGAEFKLPGDLPRLFAVYHPSQQNTQTGRLTPQMFASVLSRVRRALHCELLKTSARTVGLIQKKCLPDPKDNLNSTIAAIRDAAKRGARIICLQELFRTQYFCREENHDSFDLAEPIPGPTTDALGEARGRIERGHRRFAFRAPRRRPLPQHRRDPRRRRLACSASIARCTSPTIRSTTKSFTSRRATSACPASIRASDASPRKSAGTSGIPKARAWPACAAPTSFFYPTAIGWHPSEKAQHGAAQLDAWRTIQRAHAIANGIYVAAVNRVGFEGPADAGIEFWGNSFVADPFGQVIAQASADKEETLIVECDPRRMEEVRRNWPFLRDRRTDAYAPLLERWLD